MHFKIKLDKPGNCPICGMKLVLSSSLQKTNETNHSVKKTTLRSYVPLVVIFILLFLATIVLTYKDIYMGSFLLSKSLSYVMIGFFLTFSGFKLMDLPGFAEGYATYDLFAQKWFGYGYIYPFVEVFFGLSMILFPTTKLLYVSELLIMTFSGIGVAIKLAKHEKFQCACLGTFLKIPLTKVTLIEDFGMALLALIMLFLH